MGQRQQRGDYATEVGGRLGGRSLSGDGAHLGQRPQLQGLHEQRPVLGAPRPGRRLAGDQRAVLHGLQDPRRRPGAVVDVDNALAGRAEAPAAQGHAAPRQEVRRHAQPLGVLLVVGGPAGPRA